jgi:hypothetical protein
MRGMQRGACQHRHTAALNQLRLLRWHRGCFYSHVWRIYPGKLQLFCHRPSFLPRSLGSAAATWKRRGHRRRRAVVTRSGSAGTTTNTVTGTPDTIAVAARESSSWAAAERLPAQLPWSMAKE